MTDKNIFFADFKSTVEHDGYDPFVVKQDIEPIENLSPAAAEQIIQVVAEASLSGRPVIIAGGRCYERKGFLNVAALGTPSANDSKGDVILQVTVRVPHSQAEKIVNTLTEDRAAAQRAEIQLRIKEIQAEIEKLRAEQENLQLGSV